MPDDRNQRGPEDSGRININEDYEIRYWSAKWSVTIEELKTCIQRVGPMIKDVKKCLDK